MFNFWHSGTLALSPERQSARMSEIKHGELGLYGAERSKCNHMTTLGFKGLTELTLRHPQWLRYYTTSITTTTTTGKLWILTWRVAGLRKDVKHDATRDVTITTFRGVRTSQWHDVKRHALTQWRHGGTDQQQCRHHDVIHRWRHARHFAIKAAVRQSLPVLAYNYYVSKTFQHRPVNDDKLCNTIRQDMQYLTYAQKSTSN